MTWFLIALGAPFLWALTNVSDQFLVEKYSTKEKSSGALVLFSSLIGIFVAIFIAIFTSNLLMIPFLDMILLMLTGAITIMWVILYLYTLEIETVSAVVPWFLTVPIFGYIFGHIFLGETLTVHQQIGSIIVIFGVVLLSINFSNEKNFKVRPAVYMLLACAMIALSGVLFKYVTLNGNFWVSSFWEYVGLGISGILIYLFVPHFRREFMHMNKTGGKLIFTLNTVSEIFTITGNLLTNFALLLAPAAMVYLVSSFQPAIVLLLTLICTKFLPFIVKENMTQRILIPKIIAIIIMIGGSIFLFI